MNTGVARTGKVDAPTAISAAVSKRWKVRGLRGIKFYLSWSPCGDGTNGWQSRGGQSTFLREQIFSRGGGSGQDRFYEFERNEWLSAWHNHGLGKGIEQRLSLIRDAIR